MSYGTLSVSLTNKCNLRCRMCGSQNMENAPPTKFMDFSTWKNIIAKLPETWMLEINACGEHTLHPQFIEFIKHFAKEKTGRNTIKLSTNGMWNWSNDESFEFIEILKSLYCATTSKFLPGEADHPQLFFSIDGGEAETVEWIRRGSNYNKIINNVRRVIQQADHQVKVNIAYCVMKRNLHEAIPLLKTLPGVNGIYLNLLTVTTDEMIDESIYDCQQEYLDAAEKVRVYCKQNSIVISYFHPAANSLIGDSRGCNYPCYQWIDTDGIVYPCCRRWDRPIGNINNLEWHELVSKGRQMLRTLLREPQCDLCFKLDSGWSWKKHFASREWFDKYLNRGFLK